MTMGFRELAIFYLVVNVVVFAVYGVDKLKAIKDLWRIPERVLIGLAGAGAPGALLGMLVFRHKIRKPKFYIGVPLILIIEIAIVLLLVYRNSH